MRLFFVVVSAIVVAQATAPTWSLPPTECPPATLPEPISGRCAAIQDARSLVRDFAKRDTRPRVPNLHELRGNASPGLRGSTPPTPGGIGAGTIFRAGELQALQEAGLYTLMAVQPDGLAPSHTEFDWIFSTSTNRMEKCVEVVAIYNSIGEGSLGVFDWSCSAEDSCENGVPSPSWIWTAPLRDFQCHTTEILDGGNHLQTVIYYHNRTSKILDGDPPVWRNSVLVWNYCLDVWNLVYEHEYAVEQLDCSVHGCSWWGPILETFPRDGIALPEIRELGFETTWLYHDGTWSALREEETEYADPVTPWVSFHLDPNRSFGAGNATAVGACCLAPPSGVCLPSDQLPDCFGFAARDCCGDSNVNGHDDTCESVWLRVARTELSWSAPNLAIGSDIVRGDLGRLREGSGDFVAAVDVCLGSGHAGNVFPYTSEPASGIGEWYLVRGLTAASPMTYALPSACDLGTRDAAINAAPNTCP